MKKYVIALAGCPTSGKSSVLRMLKELPTDNNIKVLFLDEPTLGLDVLARAELWDIIRGLRGRVTVVLTTHYMDEAESLADRIGIMNEGNLVTVGTPAELMERTETTKVEEAFIRIIKEGRI